MKTFKRYSNRKIYNEETKKYATIDEVLDSYMIDRDTIVLDHMTGKDLTYEVLGRALMRDHIFINKIVDAFIDEKNNGNTL